MDENFYIKYLKYKNKYLELSNTSQNGGGIKNVAIVIKHNSYILFVQNPKGKFMLPGGNIERGEKPWNAIKREWQEETGIIFPKINEVNIISTPYNYHNHTLLWYGKSNKNRTHYVFNKHKILKPGETTSIQWFSFDYMMANKHNFKDYVIRSLVEMHMKGLV
jgi:8-oxo-dGTP pyrophosphatase MutT (NUDIX family)